MKILDEVLESILKSLGEMFDRTIEAHKLSVEALIQADNKKAVLCLENDEYINQLEEQINYDVMIAIAKYQPVASDLRRLISIIKIANDLERIADYAKTISKTAIVNSDQTFISELFLKNTLKMSNIVIGMLEDCKDAFMNQNIDEAYMIVQREKIIEKLVKETIQSNPFSLIKPDNVESYMLLMGVIRTLERSRGHISNICESIVFVSNGKFVEL